MRRQKAVQCVLRTVTIRSTLRAFPPRSAALLCAAAALRRRCMSSLPIPTTNGSCCTTSISIVKGVTFSATRLDACTKSMYGVAAITDCCEATTLQIRVRVSGQPAAAMLAARMLQQMPGTIFRIVRMAYGVHCPTTGRCQSPPAPSMSPLKLLKSSPPYQCSPNMKGSSNFAVVHISHSSLAPSFVVKFVDLACKRSDLLVEDVVAPDFQPQAFVDLLMLREKCKDQSPV
jgi:hypothetical protein